MSDLFAILLYVSLPVVYGFGYIIFGYFGWVWGVIGGIGLVALAAHIVNQKTSPASGRHRRYSR